MEGKTVNDLQEGEWKFYHQDGSLGSVGSFSKGMQEGEWKYYFESGKLWKIV